MKAGLKLSSLHWKTNMNQLDLNTLINQISNNPEAMPDIQVEQEMQLMHNDAIALISKSFNLDEFDENAQYDVSELIELTTKAYKAAFIIHTVRTELYGKIKTQFKEAKSKADTGHQQQTPFV